MSCIDAAQDRVPAIKPQVALFEKFGPEGMEVLQQIGKNARSADLLTIMDAKRGDIGNTSKMYAQSFFTDMNFDSITINPYMGSDSVKPFLEFKNKIEFLIYLRV
mgnify:CR=1 FL=1